LGWGEERIQDNAVLGLVQAPKYWDKLWVTCG
jgi:hypothetical protein